MQLLPLIMQMNGGSQAQGQADNSQGSNGGLMNLLANMPNTGNPVEDMLRLQILNMQQQNHNLNQERDNALNQARETVAQHTLRNLIGKKIKPFALDFVLHNEWGKTVKLDADGNLAFFTLEGAPVVPGDNQQPGDIWLNALAQRQDPGVIAAETDTGGGQNNNNKADAGKNGKLPAHLQTALDEVNKKKDALRNAPNGTQTLFGYRDTSQKPAAVS
jgi:hypothetical protein